MEERHSEIDPTYHIGWYRKDFRPDPAWAGKRVFIEFEGIFRDAIVWVNGVYLERHNSGYTSFALELTDHLVFGETNSVRCTAVLDAKNAADVGIFEINGYDSEAYFVLWPPLMSGCEDRKTGGIALARETALR